MSIVKIAKRKDVTFEYDANGFAQEEVLKGECDQAKFVRCSLQPGKSVKPELYSTVEHTQVFLFLEGKGYITTPRKGFNIKNEFAVFVPDYDTEEFEITCSADSKKPLEYIHIVTELNYYEDFKDDSIENKMLLEHRNLGRVSCGAVLGKGPSVVGQHIHDALMQWYIILPGSKMTYTAGDESHVMEGGDISYTPTGYYHGSEVKEGDTLDYVWFEMVMECYPGEIE